MIRSRLLGVSICLVVLSLSLAQAQQTDEVIRTNTELVQSAVTVLDKSGKFVEGLRRDQFEVLVDGKPRSLSFFDRITAGTAREREVLASTNSTSTSSAERGPDAAPTQTVASRTIVFFIDDLHLSPDSLNRTRQMLRHFIEGEMNSSDNVAVTSASGQVGFLGQFTTNKLVLDAAVTRLVPRPYDAEGYGVGQSRMTEYMALSIESSRSDDKVFTFYVEECMKGSGDKNRGKSSLTRIACETQVKNSARAVLSQAAQITQNTYNTLESLMRSSARVPGRKLVYFVSDGFLLDAGPRAAAVRDKLGHVIDAARGAGVVIYSIHAKGLVNADFHDVGNLRPMDPNGRLDLASVGELQANQDALNAMARDTGGRALRNTNYFEKWVTATLDETSNYYLLAWRPEVEFERNKKFRNVKISVIGRPDLTVRAPSGYVEGPTAETIATKAQTSAPTTPDGEIHTVLADYYPATALNLQLGLTYLNTPANGMVLTSSMHIAENGIKYGDDKSAATIRLAGVVLSDKGKVVASFSNQLNVKPPKEERVDGGVFYTQPSPLAAGIYQVRVAARDEKSSHVGSAIQWVVIPDLSKKQLTASSLLLDGQVFNNAANTNGNGQVQLSVTHTFARASQLNYWLFVYNAKRDGSGAPHLTINTAISQAGRPVLTSPERMLDSSGADSERIPFGDQVALKTLAAGRYELTVTIRDSVAGTSTTQRDYFIVR
jgi:VWFA-related protein